MWQGLEQDVEVLMAEAEDQCRRSGEQASLAMEERDALAMALREQTEGLRMAQVRG